MDRWTLDGGEGGCQGCLERDLRNDLEGRNRRPERPAQSPRSSFGEAAGNIALDIGKDVVVSNPLSPYHAFKKLAHRAETATSLAGSLWKGSVREFTKILTKNEIHQTVTQAEFALTMAGARTAGALKRAGQLFDEFGVPSNHPRRVEWYRHIQKAVQALEAEPAARAPLRPGPLGATHELKTYADHIDDVTGYLTQQLGKTDRGLRETGLDLALQRGWKLPDLPFWIRDKIHQVVPRGPMPAKENQILLRQMQDRIR